MKKIVFAISDYEGMFEELVIMDSDNNIEFLPENEEGVGVIKVLDNGKEEEWYYIDYVEVG
jgi:hypothetical protein